MSLIDGYYETVSRECQNVGRKSTATYIAVSCDKLDCYFVNLMLFITEIMRFSSNYHLPFKWLLPQLEKIC